MTPLQRFRAYMASMSPSGDPRAAIREGLYVQPPGRSVADAVAMRLELEPASTHLALGGIGSGKTTESLRAADRLRSSADATGDHIEYFDVSRQHDLGAGSLPGVLVGLAGDGLSRGVRSQTASNPGSTLATSLREVQEFARGKTDWYLPGTGPDDVVSDGAYPVHTPGAITSPHQSLPRSLRAVLPQPPRVA